MRTLSTPALESLFQPESGEVWLVFLTITHADLEDPIYLVRNSEDVARTIGGSPVTFTAMMFEIELPEQAAERMPEAQISLINVDRMITDTLRAITGKPAAEVKIELALATSPNVIEYGPLELRLVSIQHSALMVTGTLGIDDVMRRAWPEGILDNADFPGLYPG